ncbi:MAG: hypothetical protein KIT72_08365 [Polyangiaceae bacterium]|nr:hypothetical protein [Polyangiaceae bacterium]MCW5790421.1 hypothetical protein [Polyangiaceae bacterium]
MPRHALLLLLGGLACGGCDSKGHASPRPDAAAGAGGGGSGGQLTDASAGTAGIAGSGGSTPILDASVDAEAGSLPDCGPGCRLALKVPTLHAAFGHGYSTRWLADTSMEAMAFAEVGSDHTWLMPHASMFARVNGDHIAYIALPSRPQGEVAVVNAPERTRRVYYSFEDAYEIRFTDLFLTDKHVIWSSALTGLTKANLQTGEISELSRRPLDCREGCTAQGAIYCVNTNTGRVDRIDEETGELTHLDDGGALQVEGGCSPDRQKIVWVDHRPPAEPSSYHGFRGPGEIYVHDIPSGKTERVTFDSPARGKAKTFAAVGTDWVTWLEPCDTCEQSYLTAGAMYRAATRRARLDLTTGQKCYLDRFVAGGYSTLHGHHLYGYWTDGIDKYVVDVDLDHPELDWVCE